MSDHLELTHVKDGDLVLTEKYSSEGALLSTYRSVVRKNGLIKDSFALAHEVTTEGAHSMITLYLDGMNESKDQVFEHPGEPPWGMSWKLRLDTNSKPARYSYPYR